MRNIEICFDRPWLLLLLIPAAFFTLLPYFRVKKRYRRTRNRVISVVLHGLVMLLSIVLLSGFYVRYYVPNKDNELILLVDVSDTGAATTEQRDIFVETVIDECSYEDIRVGVVTFGFDAICAVPLTYDYDAASDMYFSAEKPDTSATNLAGALEYIVEMKLFEHPKTAKIVIVSDAKETDGQALNVITDVVSQGIAVDFAYIPSNYEETDAQIVGIHLPEQNVGLEKECEIGVAIYCDESTEAKVRLYDNDTLSEIEGEQTLSLIQGEQTIFFNHAFTKKGLHTIKFELVLEDGRIMNNEYTSFYNLQLFNQILVIESEEGSSVALETLLNDNKSDEEAYDIKTVLVSSSELPTTLDGLRAYDQVILNNIANSDLPTGFDSVLKQYVEIYGGGLFTLGGNNLDDTAHAYNKTDMYGSIYQSMLPVQVINYTPPIGVMFVVDTSGSMLAGNDYGASYLVSAIQGVAAGLDVLYDRDYVGIMTLDTYQSVVLEMTPRTQETKIEEAISKLAATGDGGDTVFSNAMRGAGEALRALKDVAKRHVIVVSDGMTEAPNTYLPIVKDFYETDDITFTVIGVNMNDDSRQAMIDMAATGGGRFYEADKTKDFVESIQDDLIIPTVQEKNEEPFAPIVYNTISPLVQGLDRGEGADRNRLTIELGGFYGSKIKPGADLILMGDFEVPIYAQWKQGAGMVGSFLCDLQASKWSAEFMADQNGKTFIRDVVDNLMPMSNIRPNDITVNLQEDNYSNVLSVFPKLKDGETVVGEIIQYTEAGEKSISLNEATADVKGAMVYVKQEISASNRYSRCEFVIKESGVYAIKLTKLDKDGEQVGETFTTYKTFSYSEEYDETLLLSEEELKTMLTSLTEKGKGTLIEDLEDMNPVLEGFVTRLEKVFDPRFSFMIMAIVFFLLDIAVCKFKFKWIHEIIRDNKRKKNLQ